MYRLIALAVLAASLPEPPPDLAGLAQVIDGDTIAIGKTRIGLYGIAAPDRDQSCERAGQRWPCGMAAVSALRRKIAGRSVACEARGTDRAQRTLAVCFVGEEELGAWLVAEGWAVADRRYAMDYVEVEDEARTAQRGVWSGAFELPWNHRRKR
ncbi:MAG: thermonuclease family protein [Alphaproteobacteria bacterium]